MDKTDKEPIYKKWWFWVIVVVFVIAGIGGIVESESSDSGDGELEQQQTSQSVEEPSGDDVKEGPTDKDRIEEIYSTPEKTVEYFANQRISGMDGAELLGVEVAEYERYDTLVATISAEFTRGSALNVLDSVLQSYSQRIVDSVFNGVGGADKKAEITVKWKVTKPQHADVWYKFQKSGNDMELVGNNYK